MHRPTRQAAHGPDTDEAGPGRIRWRKDERYRCEDGAGRARSRSLARVAVAALRVRDLKSNLLKPDDLLAECQK